MKLTMEKALEMMEQNGGSLNLRNTPITSLPDGLTVGDSLDLRGIDPVLWSRGKELCTSPVDRAEENRGRGRGRCEAKPHYRPQYCGVGTEGGKSMMVGVEPIRVEVKPLDYVELTEYIKAWPDKLIEFVSRRLADDDMREFAQELYDECCWPDRNGPDFRDWVES